MSSICSQRRFRARNRYIYYFSKFDWFLFIFIERFFLFLLILLCVFLVVDIFLYYISFFFYFFLKFISFATRSNRCRPSSSALRSSSAPCSSNHRCLPSCSFKSSRSSSCWCHCFCVCCFVLVVLARNDKKLTTMSILCFCCFRFYISICR